MWTITEPSPFDIYQWLPLDVRAAFESEAREHHFHKGDHVYIEGDPGDAMYRLKSGSVRLSVADADGRELLYLLFEPGDCFGISSCIDDEPRPHTARANSDIELQVLSKAAVDRLRTLHRPFDDAIMRLLARHMRMLSQFFAETSLKSLRERVASRLLSTARSFGLKGPGGIVLSIDLSQSELAFMVGSSRQSINKTLQRFRDEELIEIDHGKVIITDLDRLRSVAGH
ncbi:MAG TPA: Crp/Fnr family transcriptional regulator [Sphingobium sp.]|uniref:Crp/Fnr family transcriptional regulator n=1 Tax=Sphingobium sp. TaxID=1912891 RepID=UPI002ED042D4